MFEAITYHEKRSILNEVMLQQLMGLVGQNIDASNPRGQQLQQVYQGMVEQYAKTQQALRDKEANRVLGPVPEATGDQTYATLVDMFNYMKANLGRTYFGVQEPTAAEDGAIGTAGFGQKFDTWVQSLPELDKNFGTEMQTGFYVDNYTKRTPMPVLVLRTLNQITVVAYHIYLGAMSLNLDHLPEDYNWDNSSHYYLRGEMFSYRNDILLGQFKAMFEEAIQAQIPGYALQEPAPVAEAPADDAPVQDEPSA